MPEPLLAEVAGLAEAELYAALREAVDSHLLVVDPSGHGYAFRHALTRDAVYEDMLPGERVRLHAAYGAALERDPALGGGEADAAALAYHWYAALDLPRALTASVDAAVRALTAGAPAEALRLLERALEIWPRVPDAEAADRAGPGRREPSRRQRRLPVRGARPGAVAARRRARRVAVTRMPASTAGPTAAMPARAAARPATRSCSGTRARRKRRWRRCGGRSPCCRRTRSPGRTRSCSPPSPAPRCARTTWPEAAQTARLALEAARAAGAREAEADAAVTLGSALTYLDSAEAGLSTLRDGLRTALALSEQAGQHGRAGPPLAGHASRRSRNSAAPNGP